MGKYEHIPTENGPGSTMEGPGGEEVLHPEHTVPVAEFLSDSHYDLFVRYGYARSLVDGDPKADYLFWKSTYDKMQNRRVGFSKREQFDALILDFEERGFEGKPPIPVDREYELLDGSHRTACSAVFDIRPKVIVFNHSSHSYDRNWFKEAGFSDEELQRVDQVREELMAKYREYPEDAYAGIVWGVALEYWEEIISTIPSPVLRRAFIRDFPGKIESFIKESYLNDGMSNERIEAKAQKLGSISSKVGMISVFGEEGEVTNLKREIREKVSAMMEGYFFDNILHIIDNKKQGRQFFQKHDTKK